MSPVEKLEAAIALLERRLTTTTPGPWGVDGDGVIYRDVMSLAHRLNDIGSFHAIDDAWLVEVLHRTIDAQLAILRGAADAVRELNALKPGSNFTPPLTIALADAILGES